MGQWVGVDVPTPGQILGFQPIFGWVLGSLIGWVGWWLTPPLPGVVGGRGFPKRVGLGLEESADPPSGHLVNIWN